MKTLIVNSIQQTAELWSNGMRIKSYVISTAANGLGCEPGSYCTPTGRLRIAEKIGEGQPLGAVFKARVPTGEVWGGAIKGDGTDDDLILTRILWLEGLEDANRNTRSRYVYLHGTNHEEKLGTPVSHGCIRFSNADILEIYGQMDIGDEVIIS